MGDGVVGVGAGDTGAGVGAVGEGVGVGVDSEAMQLDRAMIRQISIKRAVNLFI